MDLTGKKLEGVKVTIKVYAHSLASSSRLACSCQSFPGLSVPPLLLPLLAQPASSCHHVRHDEISFVKEEDKGIPSTLKCTGIATPTHEPISACLPALITLSPCPTSIAQCPQLPPELVSWNCACSPPRHHALSGSASSSY